MTARSCFRTLDNLACSARLLMANSQWVLSVCSDPAWLIRPDSCCGIPLHVDHLVHLLPPDTQTSPLWYSIRTTGSWPRRGAMVPLHSGTSKVAGPCVSHYRPAATQSIN